MGERHRDRKGRAGAWAVVLAAIVLLILGFIAWNRYESRDGGDAAQGPAAEAAVRIETPRNPEA